MDIVNTVLFFIILSIFLFVFDKINYNEKKQSVLPEILKLEKEEIFAINIYFKFSSRYKKRRFVTRLYKILKVNKKITFEDVKLCI